MLSKKQKTQKDERSFLKEINRHNLEKALKDYIFSLCPFVSTGSLNQSVEFVLKYKDQFSEDIVRKAEELFKRNKEKAFFIMRDNIDEEVLGA